MSILRVKEQEYKLELSTAGAILIEEELQTGFMEIKDYKLNYKLMIVILWGELYKNHKLNLSQVCNLVDLYLEDYTLKDLSSKVDSELLRYSRYINKSEPSNDLIEKKS